MRKRFIDDRGARADRGVDRQWLDVGELATVELTSEQPAFPIESALARDDGPGWRAQTPGRQLIRLLFDAPQRIRHIRLEFEETEHQRMQEFALRWSTDSGSPHREVVRQQYNLGPPDNSSEVEEYSVDLEGLTVLELEIIPDVGRGEARASLTRLKLA